MALTAGRAGALTPAPVKGQPHSHKVAEGREAKSRKRRRWGRPRSRSVRTEPPVSTPHRTVRTAGRGLAGRRVLVGSRVHPARALCPTAVRHAALPGSVCWLHFVGVAAVRPEKQQSIKFGFNVSKLGFAFWKNSKYTSTYLGKEPNM